MKNDQPDDLEARVQSLVDKRLRDAELAKYPQPDPSLPSTKAWPKLGPVFSAALNRATDEYETRSGRDLGAAVASIYSQARRDSALAGEIEAWRTDKNSPLAGWGFDRENIESGFIANLIENRYAMRKSRRGEIVSSLPDSALGLLK